jgi:hypothetical protein
MEVCGRGELGRATRDESRTTLPNFRSCCGCITLHAAIIHYNSNKCLVTMSCVIFASRAPPSQLIKVPDLGIMAVDTSQTYL